MWDDDYDIDTHPIGLDDARVVLRGKYLGEPITVEADVAAIVIETKSRHEKYDINTILSDAAQCRFNLKPTKDGILYTLKKNPTKVNRTARVQASDRTVEALDAARVAAGAPANAKFRYSDFSRNDSVIQLQPWDTPSPVEVEFYWTDE